MKQQFTSIVSTPRQLLLILLVMTTAAMIGNLSPQAVGAFTILHTSLSSPPLSSSTILFMGKGFNKAKNKQFALQQKLELVKKQKQKEKNGGGSENEDDDNGDDDADAIKKRNDQKRFEEMLKSSVASQSMTNYLTEEQVLEEADAKRKLAGMNINLARQDRLFEDDPYPSIEETFYNLISYRMDTHKPLGKFGTESLLPWIKSPKGGTDDYTIIITDPRPKSSELRDAITSCKNELSKTIQSKIIFVNTDTSYENKRFLKKNDMLDDNNNSNSFTILSDISESTNEGKSSGSNMEFMKSYTALGEKRWSICMFIISGSNGRILKLVRDLDPILISQIIKNAISSL